MTTPYTIETLREANRDTHTICYSLWQSDVDLINGLVASQEEQRQGNTPVLSDADIVLCVTPEGKEVSTRGHLIKHLEEDRPLYVNVDPDVPWLAQGVDVSDVSGGPEIRIQVHELAYVGKRLKRFKAWGHLGPGPHAAIYFQAEVNVWKMVDKRSRFL